MLIQDDIFGEAPKVIERGNAGPTLLPQVTAIVGSLSGGIDGFAALIHGLNAVKAAGIDITTIPVVLWHACLSKMDWVDEAHDYTDEVLGRQHTALGLGVRSSWQTVYHLSGGETKTGFPSAEMQQLHCVRDGDVYYGPMESDDPAVMPDLLSLADVYRKGNPPTSGMRYCTKFMKTAGFQWWLRRNKSMLGPLPLVIRGERKAESYQREARLEEWGWALGTKQWDAAVWLPCIDWKFHQSAQLVYDTGGVAAIHPCYFWQSSLNEEDTLAAMLDPNHDERGRPRCSCVVCIFSNLKHIMIAQSKVPYIVDPHLDRARGFETKWGKTWKQNQAMPLALN